MFPDVWKNTGLNDRSFSDFPSYYLSPPITLGELLSLGSAKGKEEKVNQGMSVSPSVGWYLDTFDRWSDRWVEKVCEGCDITHTMPASTNRCGVCLDPKPQPRFTVSPKSVFIPGLRAARLSAGLAQWEVADKVGLPQAQISVFESCEQRVSEGLAKALAKVLGVRMEDLMKRAA